MNENEDAQWLRAYVEHGTEDAFRKLVERHVGLVFSVALRRVSGERPLAEEVTQTVFADLARKARTLPPSVVLAGWLHHHTCYLASRAVRAEQRRRVREQTAAEMNELNRDISETWHWLAPVLDEALNRLPAGDRDAIVLRFYNGEDLGAVGAALGVSEDAAQKRIARALEKLRMGLSRRGVALSLSSAALGSLLTANAVAAAPATLVSSASAAGLVAAKTAGTSTLTLIKGALKVMAWTKAKTAGVAVVAIILAGGTTAIVVRMIMTPTIDEAFWKPDLENLKKAPPVALVRRSQLGTSEAVVTDGMKMVGRSLSPQFLFADAYHFVNTRVILPGKLAEEHFDTILTLADHEAEGLQKALKKELGYVGKAEMRETDVLLLKVKSPGTLRLKITTDTAETKHSLTADHVVMKNQPIAQLVANLELRFEKPVLDQTDLTNRYDINMPNLWRKNSKGGYGVSNETAREELLQMLEENGLELVSSREAVNMLVVTKAK